MTAGDRLVLILIADSRPEGLIAYDKVEDVDRDGRRRRGWGRRRRGRATDHQTDQEGTRRAGHLTSLEERGFPQGAVT